MLTKIFDILRMSQLSGVERARLIAAMCAWAAMAQKNEDLPHNQIPYFFDLDLELTTERWKDILGQLRSARERNGDAWVFDGIEASLNGLQPGALESIRQALIRIELDLSPEPDFSERLIEYAFNALDRQGFYQTRSEIVDTIAEVISPDQDETVYCAYEGSAPAALKLARDCSVYLDVQNQDVGALCGLLAIALDRDLTIELRDPLEMPAPLLETIVDHTKGWPSTFDYVISFPPFGLRTSSYNSKNIGIDQSQSVEALQAELVLSRGRKWRIAIVTEGLLFRTSAAERDYRARLMRNPDFYGIVSLPRGSFGSKVGITAAMMIFHPPVFDHPCLVFIDGKALPSSFGSDRKPNARAIRQEWIETISTYIHKPRIGPYSWLAPHDEIERNDFNLTVAPYVVPDEIRTLRERERVGLTVQLGEIAEIYKISAVPSGSDEEAEYEVYEVALADIRDGIACRPDEPIKVTDSTLRKIRKNLLQEGDILLSIKGTIGKIGLITAVDGEQWIASQSFVVIRLRRIGSHMDPLILSTYLRSWLGQESLNAIAGGATVALLPMGALRQLPIPLLSEDAQNQIRHHLDEIRRLIIQRDELNERIDAIQNRLVSDFFK